MGMTDEEMIDCLGAALVSHPSWAEPLRVNVFALAAQDALEAARDAWGPEARLSIFLFRRDVLASLESAAGRSGYWVADEDGAEMFFECEREEQALSKFHGSAGKAARAWVGSALVADELARMDAALDGRDSAPLASKAFLARVAAI